jgi:hypothetical protein
MATAVLGGAVLFASVKFLGWAEPRAYSDSRSYQKPRICNAHRTVAATKKHGSATRVGQLALPKNTNLQRASDSRRLYRKINLFNRHYSTVFLFPQV